jgi:hydrogenase maturation protein HypF
MLLAILAKFLSKQEVFVFIKKYYSSSEFEVLWNQLQQNFNCLETSSAGRILDAVSLLLEFCDNQRNYKHEAVELLEKNSTTPYLDIKPIIAEISPTNYQLQTADLFRYLIQNLHQDKSRLAATAQYYLAQGLCNIIEKNHTSTDSKQPPIIHAAGGITNNPIIADYFISKNISLNQKIPRGDAGLSFGQIFWFLLTNPK